MAYRAVVALFLVSVYCNCARAENHETVPQREISVDGNVTYYALPHQTDLVTPVLGVCWEKLYFEARYNYESRDAGSLWLGTPLSFGEIVETELTPIIGGVGGSVHGVAPGLELDLTWKRLNLYSEAEYLFDLESRDGNFFYAWSELGFAVTDNFQVGVAASHTRVYDSSVEIDRGPLAAYTFGHFKLSVAVLDLDSSPIVTISVAAHS